MTIKEQVANIIERLIPEDNKIIFDSANISVGEIREDFSSRMVRKTISIEWKEYKESEE
jgi:hypothetical protein